MGRFYKSASANPIDYMYDLNVPLMEKVIEANDAQITGYLGQMDKASQLVNSFEHDPDDEKDAMAKALEYTQRIDAATDAIRKNPNNWKSQMEPIRALTRDLTKDYTSGAIGKMRGTAKAVADNNALIDKMVEKKELSATNANAYKAYFRDEYRKRTGGKGTNYNPQTGEYNTYGAFTPSADMNVTERLSKEFDKIKADKNNFKIDEITGGEMYINTRTGKYEALTPERLLTIAMGNLRGDTELQQHLMEREKVGLIKNALTNPYTMEKRDWAPEEQADFETKRRAIEAIKDPVQKKAAMDKLEEETVARNNKDFLKWNNDAYLSGPLQSILGRYAYSNTDTENLYRYNPAAMAKANYNKDINQFAATHGLAEREFTYKQAKDNADRLADLEKERIKAKAEVDKELAKAKAKATIPKKGPDGKPIVEVPVKETTVVDDKWLNYQQEDFKISNNIRELNRNTESNNKSIATNEEAIKTIKAGRPETALTPEEVSQVKQLEGANTILTQQNTENKVSLINAKGVYDQRERYLKKDMTPYEQQLWDQYHGESAYGKDGKPGLSSPMKAKLDNEAQQEYNDNHDARKSQSLPQNQKFEKQNLKKEVETVLQKGIVGINGWRDEVRKFNITGEGAQSLDFGDVDSKAIGEEVLRNSTGLRMYDAKGNRVANVKGGDKPLNFEGDEGNLKDYLEQSKGKVEAVRMTKSTGPGGVSGGQPMMEVKITGDKTIDENKRFLIPVPDLLKQKAVYKLLASKDPRVAQFAGDLLNPLDQQARNLFLIPTGATNEQIIQFGNNSHPVRVTPRSRPNGDRDYFVEMYVKDKESENMYWMPFPKNFGYGVGYMKNPEQFAKEYPLLVNELTPPATAKK